MSHPVQIDGEASDAATPREQSLSRWLARHGLSSLSRCLIDAQLDLKLLDELDDATLERMGLSLGLSLGMRLRLLRAVRARNALPPPVRRAAERRQLSVVFCDIVDSTALATRLDAEDLRCVLDAWRRQVIDTIRPSGGYLSQFLGDGALLYFGYPVADEDDAENAVRAAMNLLRLPQGYGRRAGAGVSVGVSGREADRIGELVDGLRLRVGIATGPVVLDRLSTTSGEGELSAVGRIPHLAARLQGLALPGELCVDERTARLCANAFWHEVRPSGPLHGFAEPITVYTVLGPRRSASRFEARHAGGVGALIGRGEQARQIEAAWSRVRAGRAEALLLEGEPGIGKSRLCFEIVRGIRATGQRALVLQCSPFHVDSPLHAVAQCVHQRIDALRRSRVHDDDVSRAHGGFAESRTLTVLAERLEQGVIGDTAPDRHGEDAYRRREALLALCSDWIERQASAAPLVVLVEDLHWCDPTTFELLERVVTRCAAQPLLLLVTARIGSTRQAELRLGASRIVLAKLERGQVEHLLQRRLRTHRLPVGLCEAVDSRADGVPLFIEELTSSLCESGQLERRGEMWHFDPDRSERPIPDTLQASLASRLDLLDEGLRRVVRMAACLGRSFALDDLAGMLEDDPTELLVSLHRLVAMQLVQAQDGAVVRRYEFRHALVRDVAWEGMLHTERRRLHERVRHVLLARRAHGMPVAPDRLALHLEGAGDREGAVRERRAAARLSAHRSANPERRSHLLRALALIEADPARATLLPEELGVLLELIPPCRVVSGFASTEVVEFTQRALALADDRSCDRTAMLQLVYFEWVHEYVGGDRDRCIALARAMLARATGDPDTEHDEGFRMTALRALGVAQTGAGRLNLGIAMLDESLSLYRAGRQGALIEATGMDGRVLALGYRMLASWCVGESAEAHRTSQDMHAHAVSIAHAPSLAFALFHRALLIGVLERCPTTLSADGEVLRTLGRSQRFRSWEVCGELLHALGKVLDDGSPVTVSRAERALCDSADMGVVYHPLLHDFLAQACLAFGDRDRATDQLRAAFALRARTGERWSDARLWLTAGEIAMAVMPGAPTGTPGSDSKNGRSRAITCLRAAIRSAGRSGARVWLERARCRLAESMAD